MPAHYSLYKSPVRKDEEDSHALHARLVDQHVVRMEQLTEEISDACSFNSADVKGILDALKSRLTMHLKRGEVLELEGIGTFSVSVKCPPFTDEKDIKPKHVKFSRVVFRCSKELRDKLKYMSVERAEGGSRLQVRPTEERWQRILDYLKTKGTITSTQCRSINACSKYMALKDLTDLLAEGLITRQGGKAHAYYVLKEK